jgi:deazaflavin-dependent oxidoreductase (nitroreductase family)
MTLSITPKGTHGAPRPGMPGPIGRAMQGLMVWTARRFGQQRLVVLTTIGARTGQPRSVALGRFPEPDGSFLVVASNAGAATHPAWFINMAKHPDQVWAEVGGRKFKVTPQVLTGAEREAAYQRVVQVSPGYAAYQQKTDREIPVIRLSLEDSALR